jgi:hypothetical protein
MTKVMIKIIGLGYSPRCDVCRPGQEHPFMKGLPMTETFHEAVRYMDDGNETQMCLRCFSARFPVAAGAVETIRDQIRSDLWSKLGIRAVDIEV